MYIAEIKVPFVPLKLGVEALGQTVIDATTGDKELKVTLDLAQIGLSLVGGYYLGANKAGKNARAMQNAGVTIPKGTFALLGKKVGSNGTSAA